MKLTDIVVSEAIIPDLTSGTRDDAIAEIVDALVDAGALSPELKDEFVKSIIKREKRGSTGFGHGVAVPHVKGDDVAKTTLVLARCRKGIEWQAIDGRPVHLIFLLVSPASEPENHLLCLRWIATLARNADFRRFLVDAKDDGAMRDLLREMTAKVGQ